MKDLYTILGVPKTATAAEIKKAYHKIARTCHPDVAKNDPAAANKFKEASCAYDILSNASKRKQYDAGAIDADGKPRAPFGAGASGGSYAGGGFPGGGFPGGGQYQFYTNGGGQGFEGIDLSSLFGGGDMGGFADLFGGMRRGSGRRYSPQYAPQSEDVNYQLTIPFMLAATGGETSIRLRNGKQVAVKIPAGAKDGLTLRLRNEGEGGGSALIKLTVQSHPIFTREGDNILMNLPLTLKEAVLGAKITIPTLTGKVSVTVPPNTSSGQVLRLAKKGIKGKGDLLARVQILLPDKPDSDLAAFVRQWKPRSQDPRPLF
ncbi:MAG: DnaJ domain-containing protein [Alphaproteobacteria bacterium]|nr:DnaJ domain-containing protein [Alphaproteobacteria bacterium]